MEPVWTSEQKKVIELHDRNILVSAAAGSGKTAVLVRRIIEMISGRQKPVDIDRLVIVTFTNAAAYEMKQRILDAIGERMKTEPDNLHLRRQQTLVNHAQITTIDSFCLNVIRNYFSEIDLDPGFKVADEGELKLLMADVMNELIEDYYNAGTKEFYDFVECYTPEKTDERLGDYILNLYRAAQSSPWPKEWLSDCKKVYELNSVEEFADSDIMRYAWEEVKRQIESVQTMIGEMQDMASETDGPYMYLDALNDDLIYVKDLLLSENLFVCAEKIKAHSFARLSAKKDRAVSEDKKNSVKIMRDTVKKALAKIGEMYGNQDLTSTFSLIKQCQPVVSVYIDMALEFMERFDARKRKKNIITFNDMEHLALNILVKKDGDRICYTHAADELSRKYEEILIDEYQDSNLVQEIILNSISRERFGSPNVFMVGDVKQSIYRFRLARPELFIEKYDSYQEEDGQYQKIELHNNFRSRPPVLFSVNEVFEKIMKKEFGNIAYDDNARLYPAAIFPECEKDIGKTEVLLLEHENETDMSDMEAQASLCAAKIQEIVDNDNYLCLDKDRKTYRKIRYGDIVVLMRNARENAEIFVNTFAELHVPALAESVSGYFNAYEVSVLLSLLNVIDNPRQDIPLVAVLKSYFGGFSSDELAQIRTGRTDMSFYDAFLLHEDEKKEKFLHFLGELRKEAEYKPIHELIWNIVYDTGYYDYIGSMPLGAERQANIDMLMEKAKAYESTSFHGLFNFVRYIERLKTYDVDYGEATLSSENDDVVRVMTIHKSKGLEFPVVFLVNAQRGFNNVDANQKLVIDSDLGIGTDYLDAKLRIRKNTLVKRAAARKIRLANLSEEQRILYVAMTRAREKLFVTGCVRDVAKAMEKWNVDAERKTLTYLDVMNHKSYLDMIMPAAMKENGSFAVYTIKKDALYRMCQDAKAKRKECGQKEQKDLTQDMVSYRYPHKIVTMPVKMTVSELKYLGQHVDDENSAKLVEEDFTPTVPKFVSGEEEVKGAVRGSAYHKLMELMDFEACKDAASIKAYLDKCVEEGKISAQWAASINVKDVEKLVKSPFGEELCKAAAKKRLYREKQFVMGVPADTICGEYDPEEWILVQGIVDVYYETEDGLVLADYKTDAVPYGEEGKKMLKERYKKQLDYYEIALCRLTGKPVIKKSIYSFRLGEEISLQ